MGSKTLLLSSNVILFFVIAISATSLTANLSRKLELSVASVHLTALIMIQYTFAYLDCLKIGSLDLATSQARKTEMNLVGAKLRGVTSVSLNLGLYHHTDFF
jgi:hypothetical protein